MRVRRVNSERPYGGAVDGRRYEITTTANEDAALAFLASLDSADVRDPRVVATILSACLLAMASSTYESTRYSIPTGPAVQDCCGGGG